MVRPMVGAGESVQAKRERTPPGHLAISALGDKTGIRWVIREGCRRESRALSSISRHAASVGKVVADLGEIPADAAAIEIARLFWSHRRFSGNRAGVDLTVRPIAIEMRNPAAPSVRRR